MRQVFCSALGIVGTTVTTLIGGWDSGVITLLIFMVLDYVSGLLVAGVFHKSKKTQSGSLESITCWKGLCRKVMTLVLVVIAYRLDVILNVDVIRNGVIIAFITNETISLVENAGLMGVPLPPIIMKAIDVLQSKNNKESEVK